MTVAQGTADMTEEIVVHQAPWPDRYATQDAVRGGLFCDRKGGNEVRACQSRRNWGPVSRRVGATSGTTDEPQELAA